MRCRRCKIAAVVVSCATTISSASNADPLPSIDLRGFQPSPDPRGSLYLEPASTPGAGQWNTSAWFSYAYRPVVLRDDSGDVKSNLVSHQLSMDALANVGIGSRGAVGLSVPVVLHQSGDTDRQTASVLRESSRPESSLGDLALHAKATLLARPEMGGFGLAALGRVSLPTGDRRSFVGEGAVTSELRLLAELSVIAVNIQATAGFKLRTAHREFGGKTWGDEIPWGLAVAVKPQAFGWDSKGRWTWVVESHGWLPAGPASPFTDAALSPALVGASARYAIRDVSLLAGVEGPLDRGAGVPLVRGVAAVQWAPRSHDIDHDGVEDTVDECPDLAEDRDGFEDSDGCPDFDNDDDGVPDTQDRCPKQKEDEDGFEDDDGCPDPDNDRDGILDPQDACPDAAGPKSSDPKKNGCPNTDSDGDGVRGEFDLCPNEKEDVDGFQDDDGCPDPDNDGDGIADAEDRCPLQAGPASSIAKWNGCPIPDKDGDTFDDDHDKCPTEAETWNGVADDDGCPDGGGKPLVAVKHGADGPTLQVLGPLAFKGPPESPELLDAAVPSMRAVATELNRHPSWVVAVGARPAPGPALFASTHALARSFAVVLALRNFTFRDGVAETVGWTAVKDLPGADKSGIGFLVLAGEDAPAALPPAPKKEK
jgi:OmpA-OmpF porin, OOP family